MKGWNNHARKYKDPTSIPVANMTQTKTFSPPILDGFLDCAREASKSVTIISPFITKYGIKSLVRALPTTELKVRVCSRFDSRTFKQGSSDFASLQILSQWCENWSVSYHRLPRLHAKVFVFDQLCIVTSANLTQGGLKVNYEFGLVVSSVQSVPNLSKEIEEIFLKSKIVSLDEIAEYAEYSKVNNDDADVALATQRIDEIEGDQEEEPKLDVTIPAVEIERIDRFDEALNKSLDLAAMDCPFGVASFVKVWAETRNTEQTGDHVDDPRLTEAVQDDIKNGQSYINDWVDLHNLPGESRDDFFQLFFHKSFKHRFLKDLYNPNIEKSIESCARVGKMLINLYLFHYGFSGNYRWVEKVGFFEVRIKEAVKYISAAQILDDLGANWCIHMTDLKSNWRSAHLFSLIGLVYKHNPNYAWNILQLNINADEEVEYAAYRSQDHKTILQNSLQRRGAGLPKYREIERIGPEDNLQFMFEAKALGCSGSGKGNSIKNAQQFTAKALIEELVDNRLIDIDSSVVLRQPAVKMKPYDIGEPLVARIKDIKGIFCLNAKDHYVDCALTTTAERSQDRSRRSNEKFALIGAIVRELYIGVWHSRAYESGSISVNERAVLSSRDFLNGLRIRYEGFDEFVNKYYADATEKEVMSVSESILGLSWVTSGWDCLALVEDSMQSLMSKLTIKDPTRQLQELRQGTGESLPKYLYQEEGPKHNQVFTCRIFLDGQCVASSDKLPNKKDARKNAANRAIEMLKQEKT